MPSTSIEELDREVALLALAGESVEAVKLRRHYTNDTLKEAWGYVQLLQATATSPKATNNPRVKK